MDQTPIDIISTIPSASDPILLTPSSNLKQAAVEALKTFFRNGILGGVVVATGVILMGIHTDTGMILVNWNMAIALFVFTALSAAMVSLDKFTHEWDGTKATGIIGF